MNKPGVEASAGGVEASAGGISLTFNSMPPPPAEASTPITIAAEASTPITLVPAQARENESYHPNCITT